MRYFNLYNNHSGLTLKKLAIFFLVCSLIFILSCKDDGISSSDNLDVEMSSSSSLEDDTSLTNQSSSSSDIDSAQQLSSSSKDDSVLTLDSNSKKFNNWVCTQENIDSIDGRSTIEWLENSRYDSLWHFSNPVESTKVVLAGASGDTAFLIDFYGPEILAYPPDGSVVQLLAPDDVPLYHSKGNIGGLQFVNEKIIWSYDGIMYSYNRDTDLISPLLALDSTMEYCNMETDGDILYYRLLIGIWARGYYGIPLSGGEPEVMDYISNSERMITDKNYIYTVYPLFDIERGIHRLNKKGEFIETILPDSNVKYINIDINTDTMYALIDTTLYKSNTDELEEWIPVWDGYFSATSNDLFTKDSYVFILREGANFIDSKNEYCSNDGIDFDKLAIGDHYYFGIEMFNVTRRLGRLKYR